MLSVVTVSRLSTFIAEEIALKFLFRICFLKILSLIRHQFVSHFVLNILLSLWIVSSFTRLPWEVFLYYKTFFLYSQWFAITEVYQKHVIWVLPSNWGLPLITSLLIVIWTCFQMSFDSGPPTPLFFFNITNILD